MARSTIYRAGKVTVYWDGKVASFTSGMTVDADGSPHAYHADDDLALDYLTNAGQPGNWWGIVADPKGNPYVQKSTDPAPGFYVSCTSLFRKEYELHDPRRYIDAETIPYIVIPMAMRSRVKPKFMGCHCEVENTENGKKCFAVLADMGNNDKIGEGSIALAAALGINANPKKGGMRRPVIHYKIHPGVPAVINGETFG